MSTKTQQIVELQELIDSLSRMKLNLQTQSGNPNFSDVVSQYSTEQAHTSRSGESNLGGGKQNRKQNADELRQIRSRIDRLFNTFESQQ